MPEVRSGEVSRRRLLVDAATAPRVVVLNAPAGYGKTILAAQWCRRDPRPASWLTLRRADSDPILLLSRLSEALEAIEPLEPDDEEVLRTAGPSVERSLGRLLNRVERDGPFQLALDEVDRVTGRESQDILQALVSSVPDGSQVILVSRAGSGVPLARLHLSGDVRELRAPDLAFTVQETTELFLENGVTTTAAELAALQGVTEGWPAAIGLASMAARRPVRGGPFPLRHLADYLMEEVLRGEDPAVAHFLLQTSFLPRLTGPLCDAVTRRADSGRILADLEGRNLFVFSVDDRSRWYRYHNLWRWFLRSELDRSAENVTELQNRAAAWHEHEGDPGQAFGLACRSGDLDRAGRVLLGHYDAYAARGLIASLRLWLRRCTEEDLEADPQLAIAAGWISLLLGEFERACRYLVAAQRYDLDRPSADGASSLRAAMINFRAALGLGGADQMLADGLSVIESERPQRTRWLVGGYRATGASYLVLGQVGDAVTAFEEVLLLTADHPHLRHPRVFPQGCLALLHADEGRWEQAAHWVGQAERERAHFLGGPLGLPLVVAQAAVQGHLAPGTESVSLLSAAVEAAGSARAVPWLVAEMVLRCSRLAQQAGDRKLARRALADARQACLHMEEPGILLRRVEHQQSLLLHGDAAKSLLTPAERRVLDQLETHRTLKEIGDHLYVSRATIKTHVSAIYSKLNVAGRSEAVAWLQAQRADLGVPD